MLCSLLVGTCARMTGDPSISGKVRVADDHSLCGQGRGRECTRETSSIVTVSAASGLPSVARQFQSLAKLPEGFQGKADLIAFGRKFLANPDLPKRFRQHAVLNVDDPSIYYGGGPKGYTDYPALAQELGEEPKPCLDDRWR